MLADADVDALSYRLLDGPAGAYIDAASGLLLWESPQAGEQIFRLEADGDKGNRIEQQFLVLVSTARCAPATSGKPCPAHTTASRSRGWPGMDEQSP